MLLLLVVSVIWALSFSLTAEVSALGAPFVTATRTVLAALVFLPFLNMKGLPPKRALAFAGIGALQFGLMYLLYIASFRWLQPSEVALFTIFTPLFVTLVGDLFERRMSWMFLATAGIAVLGTGICVWSGLGRLGMIRGFLLMQGANLCFALGQVLYRRVAPASGKRDRDLMGLLYLGAVASGLGFFLFNAGSRRADLGTLAIFNNMKIPLAILASGLIFREVVDWHRLAIGGTVIACALGLNAVTGERP